MKRFWAVFLCVVMLLGGTAVAESADDGFTSSTSLEGLCGIWGCCAANDSLPYLVLHEDMTYEVYDWWELEAKTTPGDALYRRGTYTFNPADGAFTMEGDETPYIVKFGQTDDTMMVGSGAAGYTAGLTTLLLEAQVTLEDDDFFEPSMLFMTVQPEQMLLLPTTEQLCADGAWMLSDAFAMPAADAAGWTFTADGKAVLEQDGQASVNATYVYDNGAMTLTLEDGTVQKLLLQFAYIPKADEDEEFDEDEELGEDEELTDESDEDEESDENTMLSYFDTEEEDSDRGYNTIISRTLIVMRDLADDSVSYAFLTR